MSMDVVFDANHLIAAFYKTAQETFWKESVQRYEMNLLENVRKAQLQYLSGKYEIGATHDFTIHERGHVRRIKSQHIADRVVLVSFVDNVLLPKIRPLLIYDNGASLKHKGIDFSRRRFAVHLNQFYREHGNKGYVRIFDFSKYFDNIRHDVALDFFRKILDPDELAFLEMVFRNFETDLSELTGDAFRALDEGIFNSLDWADQASRKGEKMLQKGVGIGSPVSQVVGIFHPYRVDSFIKTVLGVKQYGRYMDDFYIMAERIEQLDEWTERIREECAKYRLFLSDNKMRTCRMDREFVYLKTIYRVLDDGRILRRMHHSAIERERRRLIKHRRLISCGRMTLADVKACYRGWRGCYAGLDSQRALKKMDRYFAEVFQCDMDFLTEKKMKKKGRKTRT